MADNSPPLFDVIDGDSQLAGRESWAARVPIRLRGFTLMELLITVTVAGILLAIAAPSFRSYVQNSRLTTQADTLVYSLNLARDEAVKTDTTIDVCASSDGATCVGTWASGWIVVCPGNCPAGLGAAPVVLQVEPGVSNGNTVSEQVSGATTVSYSSNGQTYSATGQPEAYQFVFCDSRGPGSGQDIEINLIGRIAAGQTAGQTVAGAALGAC